MVPAETSADSRVTARLHPTWSSLATVDAHWLGLADGDLAAVYLVDIDRFKAVNDVHGYRFGDEVLAEYERRIADWAGAEAVVGRLADDLFVAVRREPGDEPDAVEAAHRLRRRLSAAVELDGRSVTRTVTIAVAVGRVPQVSIGDLLRGADDGMDAAQQSAGDSVLAVDERQRADARIGAELELMLPQAIADGVLELHYQPEVDLVTGRVVAVEGLLRWPHPTLGLLGPDAFIGLAERSGVLIDLGRWTVRTACAQLAHWQVDHPALPLEVWVNMSPTQLAAPGTLDTVRGALAEFGIRHGRLCIEVTERVRWPDVDAAERLLAELHDLGVRLAIDDFGAGYSSLLRLAALPVDALKIDRALVAGIGGRTIDNAIVAALLDAVQSFGVEVIAEGVETRRTAADLLRLGCTRAQGHLFGAALPAALLSPLLTAGRVSADLLPSTADPRRPGATRTDRI